MGSGAPQDGICGNMISPGTLNRCSVYRRTEDRRPERCWDSEQLARVTKDPNPARSGHHCPNKSLPRGRNSPVPSQGRFEAMVASMRALTPYEAAIDKPLEEENEVEVEYE